MSGPPRVGAGATGGPLGAGSGAGLLVVHGDSPFLVDREARAWLEQARAAAVSELDVEVIDSPQRVEPVRRSLQSIPFIAELRHVMLRDPPQLTERPRRGADSAVDLARALGERSPQTSVCVVAHQRVGPANPVLTLARAQGRVLERLRPRGRDLRTVADAAATAHGLRLPRGAMEHLLRLAGDDLGILDTELGKLAAYSAGGAALALADVRRLAAGSEQVDAWDILERLLSPPHARGAAVVEALLGEGVSSQQLTAVLARQLRELLLAQEVLATRRNPGAQTLAAELGVPPWQADRLARWAAVAPRDLVEEWLRALQHLDAETKLGRAEDSAGMRSITLRAAAALRSRGESSEAARRG